MSVTVRANANAVVRINGMPTSVREGQAFAADDPVVVEYPWLFESPIEEATAAPGTRRSTTRRTSS
jgi:hypothetical protein